LRSVDCSRANKRIHGLARNNFVAARRWSSHHAGTRSFQHFGGHAWQPVYLVPLQLVDTVNRPAHAVHHARRQHEHGQYMYVLNLVCLCKMFLIGTPQSYRAATGRGVDEWQMSNLIQLDLFGHQPMKLVGDVEYAFGNAGYLLRRGRKAGGGQVHFHAAVGDLTNFFGPRLHDNAGDRVRWRQEAVH
jgi:hypothetical protein